MKPHLILVRLLLVFLTTSTLFVFSACSEDDSSPDGDDDDDSLLDGDSEDGDAEEMATNEGTLEDMNGLWGQKFSLSYYTFLPSPFKKEATLIFEGYLLWNITQDGTELSYTQEWCDMTIALVEDIDFEIIIPSKVVELASDIGSETMTLSSLEEGATVSYPEKVTLFGVELEDPVTDAMPTTAEDEAIIDFENDESPGVTARINGMLQGEVYLAIRLIRSGEGEALDGNTLEGAMSSDVVLNTLGANLIGLDVQLDLTPNTQAELNRFELVRLSDEWTCEQLRTQAGDLFSLDPWQYAEPITDSER